MRIAGLLFMAWVSTGHVYAQAAQQPSSPQQGAAAGPGQAASENSNRVRARLRSGAARKETTVSESQAAAVTLTLSSVSPRPVQSWIRTAGTIDKAGKVLEALVTGPEAGLVRPGQRVRAFPPSSKSSMYQAFVTRVVPMNAGVRVDAALASIGRQNTARYVMEIVVEQGPFLSIPNEAIIEEGDKHIVYVQQQPGHYVPQEIRTGLQGELYTQVLDGVKNDDQVVTFGSFFIDAEHKLKGIAQGPRQR